MRSLQQATHWLKTLNVEWGPVRESKGGQGEDGEEEGVRVRMTGWKRRGSKSKVGRWKGRTEEEDDDDDGRDR